MGDAKRRLMFVGRGRAGKDTAIDYLGAVTTLRPAGTTSLYLAPFVAERLCVSIEMAYANRHAQRELWKKTGDEVRQDDPGLLIKLSLEHGELVGGVRDIREIVAAREENLVDLIVWVENPRAPHDPTVTFGIEHCDLVIFNDGSYRTFYDHLFRFAKFANLPLRPVQPGWSESG